MHPDQIAAGITDDPNIPANNEILAEFIERDPEAYAHFHLYIKDMIANLSEQLENDVVLPELLQRHGITDVNYDELAEVLMRNLPL